MWDAEVLQQARDRYLGEVVEFRRDLHRHPELSGQEVRTAQRVAERLRQAGLQITEQVGEHGLVAMIGTGEPCIALRADMDALPLQEITDLPWCSTHEGVMHACGHDFHTAWLLGAGLILQDVGLPRGSVKLLFQPAEEALGGALAMIADGVLEDPPVSAVCAAHVWPDVLAGDIGLRPGPNLAAADKFTITITGAGSHGANPHKGRDPIPVAAEIIQALQTIVTRRLDPLTPAVVSVCRVNAGSAFNIMPEVATLEGTVRTLTPEDQDLIEQTMSHMAGGIAQAHGCTAVTDYYRGVPPTITDPGFTEMAWHALERAIGPEHVKRQEQASMGGEDFSYFLQRCPGAVLWVGCTPAGSEGCKPLHHPGFIGDESCLAPTMAGLAAIALEYLSTC